MNRVDVLVRFTAPPPLVPPKLVNVLNEVKLPAEPSKRLLNGEKPRPNGPKKDVLMLLLLG